MDTSGPSKRLRLRRPDHCAHCGHEFAAGDEALWYRDVKLVTCLECPDERAPEPVQPGTAGASARREYERRRQQREDRAKARLGVLGAALARIVDEPRSTTAWQRGAKGETVVAKRLEKHLRDSQVRLLHDRRVPGHGKGNIDHIAIGPGGVTVVDAKNYKGKIRLQRVGGLFSERRTILQIGGREQTKLVTGVEAQVELVRQALAGSEFARIDVVGALCFAEVDGLPAFTHQQLRSVTIDGPRRVAKVANRPGDLDSGAIDRLWSLVGRALPPA